MKLRFIYLMVAALLFCVSSNAQEPYVRIAKIVVDSAQIENYRLAIKEGIEAAVRVEPGVLRMYAVYDKNQPTHVTVFETYASKEAYEFHIQTPHFSKYKSGTLTMVKSLELVDVVPIIFKAKESQ